LCNFDQNLCCFAAKQIRWLSLKCIYQLFELYRQLEAVVRIAESLAKMRLAPFAVEADVDEALRLFQVSTLDAAMSGSLAGMHNCLKIYSSFVLNLQVIVFNKCIKVWKMLG